MKKSPYETERDAVADLAETVLKNDPDKAKPLLLLIDVLLRANQRGPVGESIVLDVKKFIYSKTEHSEEAMDRFIAEIIAGTWFQTRTAVKAEPRPKRKAVQQ